MSASYSGPIKPGWRDRKCPTCKYIDGFDGQETIPCAKHAPGIWFYIAIILFAIIATTILHFLTTLGYIDFSNTGDIIVF